MQNRSNRSATTAVCFNCGGIGLKRAVTWKREIELKNVRRERKRLVELEVKREERERESKRESANNSNITSSSRYPLAVLDHATRTPAFCLFNANKRASNTGRFEHESNMKTLRGWPIDRVATMPSGSPQLIWP
ncbi:hypothetical protein EVAR_86414_1 [Eumeta japonica]|uniref:Uncharacterized protein n=1 Tax=Eumeta variegata TaxID=151549 RepID=A0A4C1W8Y3_EUMVA|nr:hypothetical protein EVAR_86414_1 [Eumeta japonica]